MTNRIALVLGLLIIAALVVDILIYGDVHVLFLAKRFFELVEWVAFWR